MLGIAFLHEAMTSMKLEKNELNAFYVIIIFLFVWPLQEERYLGDECPKLEKNVGIDKKKSTLILWVSACGGEVHLWIS